jgi:hypothetical protein
MMERGGRNHGVTLRTRIRHMQGSASPSGPGINRKDASFKSPQYVLTDPAFKDSRLSGIASGDAKCTDLDLEDANGRNKHIAGVHIFNPSRESRRGLVRPT